MENPPLESVNVPGEVPWHSNVAKTGSGGGWRSSRSTLPETANATSKFKLSSCTGLVMLVGGGGTVVGGGGAGAFWAVTAAAPVRKKSKARMPKCFAEDLAESSPQRARQHFQVRDFRELHGIRELQRILVVNPVHPRRFGDHLGLDFQCPQRRRRIGGEVRIGSARREDDDAPLL